MLATATDCKIKDLDMAAKMIVAAHAGPIRILVENNASPKMIEDVRRHLVLLCSGYVSQLARG